MKRKRTRMMMNAKISEINISSRGEAGRQHNMELKDVGRVPT